MPLASSDLCPFALALDFLVKGSSPGARRFKRNACAYSVLNINKDLYSGLFMPNVSFDYTNLELPGFAQKKLTLQRVTS